MESTRMGYIGTTIRIHSQLEGQGDFIKFRVVGFGSWGLGFSACGFGFGV